MKQAVFQDVGVISTYSTLEIAPFSFFFSFPFLCRVLSLLFTSVFIRFVRIGYTTSDIVLAGSFTSTLVIGGLQKRFSHDVDCLFPS